MRNASKTLTPVTLELGGKDAFIVCDDVDVPHVWILSITVWCLVDPHVFINCWDIDWCLWLRIKFIFLSAFDPYKKLLCLIQVAQIAVRAALQSSGQNCAGAERFYVHRDIYASFVGQVAKIVKSVSAVSMSSFKTFYVEDVILSTKLSSWLFCGICM